VRAREWQVNVRLLLEGEKDSEISEQFKGLHMLFCYKKAVQLLGGPERNRTNGYRAGYFIRYLPAVLKPEEQLPLRSSA